MTFQTRGAAFIAAAGGLLAADAARAQSVQLDPAGSNVLMAGVGWLQGTMMGNIATAVAVMAIAACGFMMLTGRLNWRYGATVILGCFVLFGAATIVGGIRSVATGL
ncbi:MAG: hypothetical protein B7Y99_03205 [Caulobacterales bacterium 32-69-10]|nr:MAG: hypothetical protein B7Y99_03205 [Caulobacterales bacterium 32-69-10]